MLGAHEGDEGSPQPWGFEVLGLGKGSNCAHSQLWAVKKGTWGQELSH